MTQPDETRQKRDLVAQWAFDTRPILGRHHLWLEEVDIEWIAGEPYQEFTRTGGVPVRAWTRGVLFEDAAQRQLLNIARLPFVHSHVAATNGAQEDWIALLDALLKGDRVALEKVTAVITGWLAHYRAYDFRDSWDDFIHEVLIRLIQSARRGAIREPSAFISYVGKITRNVLLDWIGPENRHRDLPERLQTDVESRVPDLRGWRGFSES